MSQTSPAQPGAEPQPAVSADHPGVTELFALLAYGEVAAFYRLTEEARMAPNLAGRISMASMAAARCGTTNCCVTRWPSATSTSSRQ